MEPSVNKSIKARIIEQLGSVNDTKLLREIDEMIQISNHQSEIKKFTKEELIRRAKQSNEDVAQNRVFSQRDAEKSAKMW